jgi:hypothetical protein
MLYAAGGAIGEAESADGVTWRRLDADPSTPALDPVLEPAPPVDPARLAPGERPPFDVARVGDPHLAPRITPAGRLHVRVLYTGYDAAGRSAIGFAARYGDSGRLARQRSPSYAVDKLEAAPALFEWSGGVMLYVQQENVVDQTSVSAIAAAFAPPTETLPGPAPYPSDP